MLSRVKSLLGLAILRCHPVVYRDLADDLGNELTRISNEDTVSYSRWILHEPGT
jgi:hypothetical protein